MTEFTPVSGFLGGVLIGAAAVILLATLGRVAGVSGILGDIPDSKGGTLFWRLAFIAGLVAGPMSLYAVTGDPTVVDLSASWPVVILAGLLVGFGTRMGSGCTSGHGVCGLARLSPRSLAATAIFMAVAGLTVFFIRHVV
ncbi:MAG: YeeE/YedE family protein [Alphaproteobacteria bacterium]|nr:YeeE/YedE family protein [Alphaproteobacteria bacterium]